jgi:TRAP-type mannitol/chloroaromatic compound transport system substrate-binding protein
MKKVIYCLMVVALLAALTVSCAPKPTQVIEIKSACFLPTNHPVASWVPTLVERINKACAGELVWTHLGGPEVVPGLDQYEAVMKGTLDASFLVSAYYFSQVPEAYCMNLSKKTPWEERKSGFFDMMVEVHKAANTMYLGRWHNHDGFYIWPNKPVKTVADLKGTKIRGGGICYDPWFAKIGVTPVQIPSPDTYTALQRGVVDGFAWPCLGMVMTGWTEVTKYCINHGVYPSSNAGIIMNLAKWNTIPKRTQDKLLKAIEEAEYDMVPHYLNLCKQERETAVKAGVTLLELSPNEAKWYVDIAYEADWEFQKAKTTAHYDALRKALGF